MFYTLIEITSNFIDCAISYYILSRQLTSKHSRSRNVLLFAAYFLTFTGLKMLPVSTACSVSLLLCCIILYAKLYSADSLGCCAFWAIVFTALVMFADETAYLLIGLLTPDLLADLEHIGLLRLAGMILYYCILLPGGLLAARWKRLPYPMSARRSILFYGAALSGIAFFYTQIDMTVYLSQAQSPDSDLLHSSRLASILMLLFFFLLILIVASGNRLYAEYQQMKLLQLETAKDLQIFRNYEETASLIHLWRHDYQHHISTLSAFARTENWQVLKEYLSELNTQDIFHLQLPSTGNLVIDMILASKVAAAQNNHICIDWSVFLPEESPLSPAELTSLLGNALDNALEACRRLDKSDSPTIELSINPQHGSLLFQITNPSPGNYRRSSAGELLSTKADPGHGLGIRQIRQIAEKHHGFLDIQPEADRFVLRIMIPLPSADTAAAADHQ